MVFVQAFGDMNFKIPMVVLVLFSREGPLFIIYMRTHLCLLLYSHYYFITLFSDPFLQAGIPMGFVYTGSIAVICKFIVRMGHFLWYSQTIKPLDCEGGRWHCLFLSQEPCEPMFTIKYRYTSSVVFDANCSISCTENFTDCLFIAVVCAVEYAVWQVFGRVLRRGWLQASKALQPASAPLYCILLRLWAAGVEPDDESVEFVGALRLWTDYGLTTGEYCAAGNSSQSCLHLPPTPHSPTTA